jgi:hypothetical protein
MARIALRLSPGTLPGESVPGATLFLRLRKSSLTSAAVHFRLYKSMQASLQTRCLCCMCCCMRVSGEERLLK